MEAYIENDWITGTIDILDVRFGNLWTNISRTLFKSLDVQYGDPVEVVIKHEDTKSISKRWHLAGRLPICL